MHSCKGVSGFFAEGLDGSIPMNGSCDTTILDEGIAIIIKT